jgi:hypothetical protein
MARSPGHIRVQPIFDLAKSGTRILIIPGDHERSEFSFDLFHGSAGIFVFDQPKSLSFNMNGYSIGNAGFPFVRKDSIRTFLMALEETEYHHLSFEVVNISLMIRLIHLE